MFAKSVELPVASVPAASAATAAPAAPASAPASTVAAAPASAPASAFSLRARFIDHQRAAQEIFAVQRRDCFFGFRIVADLGEPEAARLARKTVAEQRQGIRLHPGLRKQSCNILFRSLERQVSHIQFLHGESPCAPVARAGTTATLKRQDRGRGSQQQAGYSRLKRALQQLRVNLEPSLLRSQPGGAPDAVSRPAIPVSFVFAQ
jgi:hypothetical protein